MAHTQTTSKPARRRAFGQNLLTTPARSAGWSTAAGIRPGDLVYEVGAGRGVLTAELVRQTRQLVAYEVDPALATALGRLDGPSPSGSRTSCGPRHPAGRSRSSATSRTR